MLYWRAWLDSSLISGFIGCTLFFRRFQPESIHIATLPEQIAALECEVRGWDCAPIHFYDETEFLGLGDRSKSALCQRIASLPKLYQAGWFYQQLLKLGCQEVIPELTDWTLVWDSDLIPFAAWPLLKDGVPASALLQHKSKGNPVIVAAWERWIRDHLGVLPIADPVGTFIPHHMWFYRPALQSLCDQIQSFSGRDWPLAIMDTVATHESFSEYWAVASWMAARYPDQFAYHRYELAGATTERFFEDGRGKLARIITENGRYSKRWPSPKSHTLVCGPVCMRARCLSVFLVDWRSSVFMLPSSLSLESSPRHIDKLEANRHLEEQRSRWLVRAIDREGLGIDLNKSCFRRWFSNENLLSRSIVFTCVNMNFPICVLSNIVLVCLAAGVQKSSHCGLDVGAQIANYIARAELILIASN